MERTIASPQSGSVPSAFTVDLSRSRRVNRVRELRHFTAQDAQSHPGRRLMVLAAGADGIQVHASEAVIQAGIFSMGQSNEYG